jgi:hypothetical protein
LVVADHSAEVEPDKFFKPAALTVCLSDVKTDTVFKKKEQNLTDGF